MKKDEMSMQGLLPAVLLMVFLMSCGGSQSIPDWTYASFNQMEDFKKAYLEGKTGTADLHFQRAVAEIKKSGDLNLLAKAYLNRYAVQAALLESFRDDDFLKIQTAEPNPAHAGFYAFLKGNFSQADRDLLPPQYSRTVADILAASRDSIAADVRQIEDPLSRLVMTGLLVRYGYENAELLNGAVETASRQGWKKALLVYLERLHAFYMERREGEKADKIKQRILLIQS
ncbi:MAG: hypothetical protein QG555_436 [Thermodesulfobacteriota bacterium]|nr:hypothetical protein [Thermodesulfobacteriota bacterium]